MLKLGLLGKNIQQSRSKEMYEKILGKNVDYSLFDFNSPEQIPALEEFFSTVDGLSITAPFKGHFLNEVHMTSEVKELNAINCIRKTSHGFEATNTDYLACEEILKPHFDKDFMFFLLGDGAMSFVLQKLFEKYKQNFTVLSRRRKNLKNFSFVDNNKKYFIINCCHRDFLFEHTVDENLIHYWDLNYNVNVPSSISLIDKNKYLDGMELLFLQAKYALRFWNLK